MKYVGSSATTASVLPHLRKSLIFLPVVVVLAAPAVAGNPPLVRLERSLDAMGTTYTIVVYGKDRFELDAAVEEAFDEVKRLDGLLSNYRPDSELSKVNREAAAGPVQVSEEFFQLLQKARAYSQASEGTFDMTVGPLMKIWGFYKGTGRIPHRSEIRTAMERVGYQHMQLDPARRSVRFTRALELDPGGIGKGYAVDRMVEVLKRNGIASGLISAGRSTIYAIGVPPSEPKGWSVTIPNPRNESKAAAEYFLKDESMSTSGSTEKFFVVGGKRYTHIMDPRTGYPAEGMLSVSVIAPKALDSEAWTKPFFVLGRDWAARYKNKEFRVFLCEDGSETRCESLQ